MTIDEILAGMPNALNKDKAEGLNVIIGWNLTGDEPGEYTLTIADQTATIDSGISDDAAATLTMDSDDFKMLQTGELNGMMAFMSGKIKIDGDMGSVMKIQGVFEQ